MQASKLLQLLNCGGCRYSVPQVDHFLSAKIAFAWLDMQVNFP